MVAKEKQSVETSIALISQEQTNQGKTLARIEKTIENMAFVSQKDYDKDMLGDNGVIQRLRILEDYKNTNNIGTTFATLLSSKGLTVIAVAIIGAAIFILTKGAVK